MRSMLAGPQHVSLLEGLCTQREITCPEALQPGLGRRVRQTRDARQIDPSIELELLLIHSLAQQVQTDAPG